MAARMLAAEASPVRRSGRPVPPVTPLGSFEQPADKATDRAPAAVAEAGSSSAASDDSAAPVRSRSRRARRRIRPTAVAPAVAAREASGTPFSQASRDSPIVYASRSSFGAAHASPEGVA